MNSIQDFIDNLQGTQKEIIQYLNDLLLSIPDVEGKIRYKIPFYYRKSWVCYLNPIKKNKVELAFIRGNELSNEYNFLDNKGRKQVYGIEFSTINEVDEEMLYAIIMEALVLDETIPYTSKKKKK